MSVAISRINLFLVVCLLFIVSCTHNRDNIHDPLSNQFSNFSAPSIITLLATKPSEVAITWSDPNNREKCFIIYKGSDSADLKVIESLPANHTEWTDTACVPFTIYYYKVAAVSMMNDTFKPTTTASLRTPYELPTDIPVTATLPPPNLLNITRITETSVKLFWQSTIDNSNSNVLIWKGLFPDSLLPFKFLPSGSIELNDTLHERRNYYYSVSFYDSSFRSERRTSWVSPLVPPANLTVQNKDSAAYCTWIGTEYTTDSIQIERWSSRDSLWQIHVLLKNGSSVYLDKQVKQYTEYRYKLAAFSGRVYSAYSTIGNAWFGASIPPSIDTNTIFLCRFDTQNADTLILDAGKSKAILAGANRQAGKFRHALLCGANKSAKVIGEEEYSDSSISIDFWIKPQTDMSIINERFGILSATPGPFRIFYYSGRIIAEFIAENGARKTVFAEHAFPTTHWSHLVVTLYKGKSSIFINDTLKASSNATGFSFNTQQDTLHIGKAVFPETGFNDYKYFNGLIDEVFIAKRPDDFFVN